MFKKLMLATAFTATVLAAQAVPALRKPFTVIQPDGTELVVRLVGDEYMHFTLTDDDKVVVQDANGQYSYARVTADGQVVSTGIRALGAVQRPVAHEYLATDINTLDLTAIAQKRNDARPQRLLNTVQDATAAGRRNVAPSTVQRGIMASQHPQSGIGRTNNCPNTGTVNGLIILVEYQDVKFDTKVYSKDAKDYFDRLIHQEGFSDFGGTGSARDYFLDQSLGQFNPQFDVLGPVTLPNNRSYYGGNDAWGDDKNPHMMVVHAVQALDADIDFSKYDNDGDGVIDNIFIFYAGTGEATGGPAETVWPHAWYVYRGAGLSCFVDGKRVDSYACSNELEAYMGNIPDGIGTFVHEFSHVLGLPDLYHTSSSSATYTPGAWSVLDYGPYNNNSRTPPSYSAYERNAMGWLNAIVLGADAESVTLEEIQQSNTAALIPTSSNNEFFLLENRQLTGWDKYLPGHGMLIWHVDYQANKFTSNVVNNTASHQYVDIVEAGGTANNGSSATMAAYTWPGTKNKTSFTATTTPALKDWSGNATACAITNIQEQDGIISFDNNGGRAFDIPVGEPVTDTSLTHFTASWSSVAGATDYLLTVTGIKDGGALVDETADMGSGSTPKLPDGWTSKVSGTYTSGSGANANFGNAAPALKLGNTGEFIKTRYYESAIKKVSFWVKGQGTDSSQPSTITIMGYTATGDSIKVWSGFPKNATGVVTTLVDEIPAGVYQLKFEYTKNKGNVAIDDIVVTAGGVTQTVVAGYDRLSTGGATTWLVNNLPQDTNRFSFTVQATDGKYTLRPSDPVYVDLPTQNAVTDIAADGANAMTITMDGRTLTVTTAAQRLQVYDAAGAQVRNVAVSDGRVQLTLPAAGMYILRAGTDTAKVLVR